MADNKASNNENNNYDKVFKYADVMEIREADPNKPTFNFGYEPTPIEELKVIEEKVNIREVVFLRQFKLLQEIENKILNGRIKDKETEKIKLQYYKVYLQAISTFIQLSKGVNSIYYDKEMLEDLINADIQEID